MSGLAGILGPLLTAGTQQAGTYENAEANASQLKREGLLQGLMFQRQANLDNAHIGFEHAETAKDQREADAPHLGDPNYASSLGAVAGAQEQAKLPSELELAVENGTITRANAEALAGVNHGYKSQEIAQQGNIQAGLQGNSQLFQAGQLNKSLAAAVANKLTEQKQAQSVQLVPNIVNGFRNMFGAGGSNTPSGVTAPIQPTVPTDPFQQFIPSGTP